MAQPLPNRGRRKPLRDYLRASRPTDNEVRSILRDAAEEAERLIPELLKKRTSGGKIRAAQLTLIRRELRAMHSSMWGDLDTALRDGMSAVAEAAYLQAEDILLEYLRHNNQPTDSFLQAMRHQAREGMKAIFAKAANGIPLSLQVYRTKALTQGWVNRIVQNGILLQHSAKDIAKDVAHLIRPDVPGGVSYAAQRLARTELNNAFKTAQEERYKDEPWTMGMQWNLSGSHPAPDECNEYAEADDHGLGKGVYPVGKRPHSHPNCLCYLTSVQADEDEFIEGFLSGEYDDYLGDTVGEAEVIHLHDNERTKREPAGPIAQPPPPQEPVDPMKPRVGEMPFGTVKEMLQKNGGSEKDTEEALAYIKNRVNFADEKSGLRAEPRVRYNGNQIVIKYRILDKNGKEVGEGSRRLEIKDGVLEAKHSFLELNKSIQGSGFAARLNENLEAFYRANSVEGIRLNANIDVGGYAWAKQGYDFHTSAEAKRLASVLENEINTQNQIRSQGPKIMNLMYGDRAIPDELIPEIESLIERSRSGDESRVPTPIEFAMLGWKPGLVGKAAMWFGKAFMLGQSWDGRKGL